MISSESTQLSEDRPTQLIDLSDIIEPDKSIRFSINEADLFELQQNILQNGLLQPIILQIKNNNGKYEIIAGHRRYLACKNLNFQDIRATIINVDKPKLAILKASENLARVNLSAIEEAKIYKDLLDNHSMSYNDIANKFGKTKNIIIDRIQLLRLPNFLLEAIHEKKITQSVGKEFLNFDDIRAQQYFFNYVMESGANVKTIRSWVSDYKREKLSNGDDTNSVDPPTTFTGHTPKQYFECDGCHNPEEYGQETLIRLCRKCANSVKNESEVR